MTDVFISYSRKDIAFARILHQALKENHLETWIDWQDIPPSADWLAEVYEAIEQADSFIFIISEESVASEICGLEIAHAAKNNKRLIPIVINNIDAKIVPNELTVLNWIFFREEDEAYAHAIQDLITAIQTDFSWVKEHTRLQNRALEWERKEHEGGFLLRGRDLTEAESWLVRAAEKDPQPTALQTQYILASRSASTRRQRITMGAVLSGMVLAIALGILAWTQRNLAVSESNAKATEIVVRQTAEAEAIMEAEMRATAQAEAVAEADARATQQTIAEEQRDIAEEQKLQAEARGLAVSSIGVVDQELDLALLLGVEAIQKDVNYFTQNALLTALQNAVTVVRYIYPGQDAINAVAYARDGSYLISAGKDGDIHFWDPSTGAELVDPLVGHDKGPYGITDIEISPDGSLLASVGDDGTVRLWDLEAKQYHETIKSEELGADVVTFSKDGSKIYVGYRQGYIWAWDLSKNKELGLLDLDGYEVQDLLIHPDGEYFITFLSSGFISQEIKFRDLSTGFKFMDSIDLVGTNESITAMAISPNGKNLVFGTSTSNTHYIYLWDLENNQQIERRTHSLGKLSSLMYSPDGKYIISGSQALCIWENDLGNNYVYDVFPGNLTDMDLRGDGRSIVVALDDGEIRLYKMYAYTENSLAFQEHTGEGFGVSIAFSPSGEVLASTSGGLENNGDTRIELWNAQDFSFLDFLDLKDATDGEIITSIDFSMNGDVLVAGTSAQRIFIWDLATRELLGEPLTDLTGAVSRVRFTPDGRHLISLDSTPALRVWTIEDTSGEKTRINRDARVLELEKSDSLANLLVIIPQGESCPFAISPDGKQIALKGANNTIRLLDLDLFQEMGDPLQGAPSQIMDFTFSPDGSMLAGSSYDGSILIWDLFTHEQIGQVMTGHQGAVQKLIFSDDGKVLFSASDDGTIRLWDVESQLPIGQPISNNATALAAMYRGMDPMTAPGGFKDSRILDMAKSPNGSVLVISNEQKFLWTLDLAPESWSQRACFIAGRNFNSEEWDLYLPNEPYHESCPSAIVQPLAIRSQVQSAIEYGKSLVKQGDIEGALAYYPQGGPLDSEAGITADQWNHLCWYGSIWGYPNEVMYACENAVAAAPSDGAIRDSRGLTRALIGDFEGAIEDFHFFVQWARETDQESFAEEIVQREAWMAELEAGRNPIDDATLKAYR